MILTNKEGFCYSVKKEKRLKFFKIQKHFNEVVRERRRAQVPINRESYEDDRSFFDRQTTGQFPNRTTYGSELISDAILNMNNSGATTGVREIRGLKNSFNAGRERSNTEFHEGAKLGQSLTGGARSTFISQNRGNGSASFTKKSQNSESTKKQESSDKL